MADKNEGIIQDLIAYLSGRNMMPEVKRDRYLGDGTSGEFSYSGGLPPAGVISLASGAGPESFGHELTHAAERQIVNQYYENVSNRGNRSPEADQFQQAYDKLRFRGTALDSLKKFGSPEWWKENENYRATQTEIPAWAVGSVLSKDKQQSYSPPQHLNSTAATEMAVLLELATRQNKVKQSEKK